jgi:hypothetical protein
LNRGIKYEKKKSQNSVLNKLNIEWLNKKKI